MGHQIFKLHLINGYLSNIFLAEYDHGLLLLDGGSNVDVSVIEEFCRDRLDRSPLEIKLTVVSHMHTDHSGGACTLREKYGVPVAAHEQADQWYAGPSGFLQHRVDCLLALYVGLHAGKRPVNIFAERKIHPDFFLGDGASLPFFEDWRALHLPGHTMHDTVVYNEGEGVLYLGDTIVENRGRYHPPLPVVNRRAMILSYERLAKLDPPTVLFAHGKPKVDNESPLIFKDVLGVLSKPRTRKMKLIRALSLLSPVAFKEIVTSK